MGWKWAWDGAEWMKQDGILMGCEGARFYYLTLTLIDCCEQFSREGARRDASYAMLAKRTVLFQSFISVLCRRFR